MKRERKKGKEERKRKRIRGQTIFFKREKYCFSILNLLIPSHPLSLSFSCSFLLFRENGNHTLSSREKGRKRESKWKTHENERKGWVQVFLFFLSFFLSICLSISLLFMIRNGRKKFGVCFLIETRYSDFYWKKEREKEKNSHSFFYLSSCIKKCNEK